MGILKEAMEKHQFCGQMVKYCTKMETTIKLNFTMINLRLRWFWTLPEKWKEKIGLLLFLLGCFYFCKITFFITGNTHLILKIFNNKTDIILFFICKLLLRFFILCAFIYIVIVDFTEVHLSPQISFLFLSLSCQSWMVITTLFQIMK